MMPRFLQSLDSDDDIFISYSRLDGEAYLTGIDAALSNLGFSCFSDKRGTDSGSLLPPTLLQKVRSCKTLVLLGTAGAIKKPENITSEVREFAEANGTARIVPISFDLGGEPANWSEATWNKYVEGKSCEHEDANALKTGLPSNAIVRNIETASNYMKSKDRLRKYRRRTLVSVLSLSAAGIIALAFALSALIFAVFEFHLARSSRSDASLARAQADKTIAQAKSDTKKAVEQAQGEIQKAQEDASTKIAEANTVAKSADERRASSERQAHQAALLRTQAESAAKEQQEIADSRSLANASQMILRQHPDELPRSISVAANALTKYSTVEADAALRESLELSPRLVRTAEYEDAAAAALSPDGRYFAIINGRKELRVFETGSHTSIATIACQCDRAAVSNDPNLAALTTKHAIQIVDLKKNEPRRTIQVDKDAYVSKLALSPGGRYLAVMTHLILKPSKIELFDTGSGALVKSLNDNLDMKVGDIAFGPRGDLALGGTRSPMEGRNAGRVIIWLLSNKLGTGETGPELTEADFSNFIDANLDVPVSTIALSADRSIFATDKAVWERTGSDQFKPLVRLPVVADIEEARENYRVDALAFQNDGANLIVIRPHREYFAGPDPLSSRVNKNEPSLSSGDSYSREERRVEVWDATGHGETINVFQAYSFGRLGFEPGGQRFSAFTQGANGSSLHFFAASTGIELDAVNINAKYSAGQMVEVTPNLDFILTIDRERGSVLVHDVWKSKAYSLLYPGGLKRFGAAVISSNGRFLALIDQDLPSLEDDTGTADRPAEAAAAVAVIYRLEGDAYVRFAQLQLAGFAKFVGLTPDGRFLATYTVDRNQNGKIQIWSLTDGRDVTLPALRRLERTGGLALSPDGKSLLVVDTTPKDPIVARVWRLADGVEIVNIKQMKRMGYAFSPGGRYLLMFAPDTDSMLIELSTGRFQRGVEGLRVRSAAFSRDERALGLADDVGVLHVYGSDDINNEVARLPLDEWIDAIAFSDDHRLVATVGSRFNPFRNDKPPEPAIGDVAAQFDQLAAATDHQLRVSLLRPKDLLAVAAARLAALPDYARPASDLRSATHRR